MKWECKGDRKKIIENVMSHFYDIPSPMPKDNPLTAKGKKIMSNMKQTYGKKAKQVFYASKNSGRIKGVD
jgi:hypothetical protein